jgi:hypothetical protein
MEHKVTVMADQNGNVIGVSQNNPEYGYIRIAQQAIQINEDGWLRHVNRSALLKGKVTDLQLANYKEGTTLPGKIIVIESLIPFNMENPDRDLKIAGDTGIICRLDDEPIYRQTFYTQNPLATDEFINHTNKEEIREVVRAQKAMEELHVNNIAKEPQL